MVEPRPVSFVGFVGRSRHYLQFIPDRGLEKYVAAAGHSDAAVVCMAESHDCVVGPGITCGVCPACGLAVGTHMHESPGK